MIKYVKYLIPLIGEVTKVKVYDKDGRVNVKRTMMRRSIIYSIIILSFALNAVLIKRLAAMVPIVTEHESHSHEIQELADSLKTCELNNQFLTNALNNTLGGIKFDLSSIQSGYPRSSEPEKAIETKDKTDAISKDTGHDNQAKDGPVH